MHLCLNVLTCGVYCVYSECLGDRVLDISKRLGLWAVATGWFDLQGLHSCDGDSCLVIV